MKASQVYAGRVPCIGKHKALNNVHVKSVIDRLDAAGDREAADTLIWMLWWRDLDYERERFLISDWQERLAEKIGEPLESPASVIEAAAAGETEGLDPKGESAVAESETPNPRSGNGEAQG